MNIPRQRWFKPFVILMVLGGVMLGLSFIPFESMYRFLSQFEADRSFDSLREPVYQTMTAVLRLLGMLSALLAALTAGFRERVNNLLEALARSRSMYSLRRDISAVWHDFWKVRENVWLTVGIGAVTAIGFALRFVHLSDPIAYDEAYSYLYYAARPLRYIVTDYSAPNNHILNSLLMALSTHLLGNQPWVVRLPAFLAGVLCIPATYAAGRGLYDRRIGLIGAALAAVSPILISYSTNARGYSLTCLFTLILLAAAAYLRRHNSPVVWSLFIVCAVLGLYAVPVMLYPIGAVAAWMLVYGIRGETRPVYQKTFLWHLIGAGIGIGLLTALVYSPVILFGTGYRSIISNGVVSPQSWADFTENIVVKSLKIWEDWNLDLFPFSGWILGGGFILSFLTHRRVSNTKIHFAVPALVWIALIVVLQRVTPWTRVWQFLLIFLFIWAAAGWVGLAELLPGKRTPVVITVIALVLSLALPMSKLIPVLSDPQVFERETGPEEDAADYLKDHLEKDQMIVAAVPENIEVMYYLSEYGIPMTRLYNEDKKVEFTQAVVITSDRYGQTVESVLQRHQLESRLDTAQAELVFQAKQVSVYKVNLLP
jgi:uncharacterized membrane protein